MSPRPATAAKSGACRPRRAPWSGQLTQSKTGWHVTVEVAHKIPLSLRWARAGYCCSIAALLVFFGCESLQNAIADGETSHAFFIKQTGSFAEDHFAGQLTFGHLGIIKPTGRSVKPIELGYARCSPGWPFSTTKDARV